MEVRLTRNDRPTLPTSPFAPITSLFLVPGDSDLHAMLIEAHALIEECPRLVMAVEEDLDRHALRKKAARVADAQWEASRTALLPGMPEPLRTRTSRSRSCKVVHALRATWF